jgi:alpha-ribazole phosphatase
MIPPDATVFLVRHGHTAANKTRYLGWEDEPLDAVGLEQAQDVAARLADETIDAVYASPLARARDTARPLAAARRLDPLTREALKEINYGEYQGLAKDGRPLNIRREHALTPLPGGESLRDVAVRIAAFFAELTPRIGAGARIAIVSHFWTSRILFGTLLGLPLEGMIDRLGYKPATGSILAVRCRLASGGACEVIAASPLDPGNGGGAS